MHSTKRSGILKIVLIYAIFGGIWIYFSDSLLGWLIEDTQIITQIAIFKGLAFIFCTSLMLFILISRHQKNLSKAASALENNEYLLQSVLKTIPDLVWVKNPNGVYITCNRQFERLLGAKQADIIGKTDDDFVDRNLADFLCENDGKAINAGKPRSNEEWVTFVEDGRHVLLETIRTPMFDSSGDLIGVLGIGRDITERKRMEEELRESEDRFRLTFNSSPDSININRMNDGLYIDINEGFTRLTGYTRDDVIGRTSNEINIWLNPDDRARLVTGLKEKGYYENLEALFRKKDGVLITGLMSARTISIKDVPHIISITRDISDRKIYEKELVKGEKLESLGILAGGIAHDFNNILSAILGYAELAREECSTGSTAAEDMNQVIQAGNRAKELVKQILAFSRQNEATKIPLQPVLILKEAIKLLRSSIPVTIEIQQHIDKETGFILAEPTQIHQVIMNLCINAYHAMEETGGTLSLSIQKKMFTATDLPHDSNIAHGAFVELSVEDNGPGIAPEVMERIFDPYFTTKEMDKGTGMGLAIVHGIVKNCGGFITCHSEVGKGAIFRVAFPVLETQTETVDKPIDTIPGGTERILFIDDEKTLAEVARHMLERMGYVVTVRTSSLEALSTFKNDPDAFDLVITDQTMPEMAGIDLARTMLQIRPGKPIILCTGYSSLISEDKVKAYGIMGFAMKPLSKNDLTALIRKILDERETKSL